MNLIKKLIQLIKKNDDSFSFLLIKKERDNIIKEYNSVEEAIKDLEMDNSISPEKIMKLKLSLENLKNRTTIKIKNGKIIK